MRIYNREYNFFHPRWWIGQVDSRALSMFRIIFAVVLLKDALYHLPLAHWFYSDKGIVPRSALWNGMIRTNHFSLMDALPYTWQAQLFFLIWSGVLILLLVGYRTRLMTVLNFILILSVHERNLYVLSGADTVFRVLSFWMLFLPLAHYYSIDAIRRRWKRYSRSGKLHDLRVEDQPHTTFALPLRLIQIQFALIYLFTFLLKLPGSIWEDGDALFYALQLQSLTLPMGDWFLANAPYGLLRFMSRIALITEGTFFFFVFFPLFQPVLRLSAIFMGFMLHFGIGIFMAIQNFTPAMYAGYILLFEARWVRWLDEFLRLPRRQPVSIALPEAGNPLWLLLAITKAREVNVIQDVHYPGLVLDTNGNPQEGLAAWRLLGAHLPFSRVWLWLLNYAGVRHGIERMASWIVRLEPLYALPHPHPLPLQGEGSKGRGLRVAGRILLSAILLPLMGIVIWWNLFNVTDKGKPIVREVPDRAFETMQFVGLWQGWDMFAPYPSTTDGWFIIPGEFEDGSSYDLRTGELIDDRMPRWFLGSDSRWKKYEFNLYRNAYEPLLGAWGSYYCRLYNDEQKRPEGQRLATLELHFRVRRSYDPGGEPNEWDDVLLWRHWCYEEYAY